MSLLTHFVWLQFPPWCQISSPWSQILSPIQAPSAGCLGITWWTLIGCWRDFGIPSPHSSLGSEYIPWVDAVPLLSLFHVISDHLQDWWECQNEIRELWEHDYDNCRAATVSYLENLKLLLSRKGCMHITPVSRLPKHTACRHKVSACRLTRESLDD